MRNYQQLAIIKQLFAYHPDFFIAPFDRKTEDYPNNSKQLFRKFIRQHELSDKYFMLNEELLSLLEEHKMLDDYYFAITGKPKFIDIAVCQQDALNEGVTGLIDDLLGNFPELVELFFKNGRLLETLAFDYEKYLENPPATQRRTLPPPQIVVPAIAATQDDFHKRTYLEARIYKNMPAEEESPGVSKRPRINEPSSDALSSSRDTVSIWHSTRSARISNDSDAATGASSLLCDEVFSF